MLKKAAERRIVGAESAAASDPALMKKCPTLWHYMTQKKWDDGTPRQTSSFTVFEEGGLFKAVLKDRDMGVCCWVASDTLSGLFDVLEASLSDPATDWRAERVQPGDKAKRVKKGG